MKIIVGLGNPGFKYEGTRHNVGFEAVDRVVKASGISVRQQESGSLIGLGLVASKETVLAKPLTYMNRSGSAVSSLLSRYKQDPSQLIVIHDDLDLEVGRLRIKVRGGDGGHRGIESILQRLGADRFTRIKIGIGRPVGEAEEYVLTAFQTEERQKLDEVLEKIPDVVELVVEEKIQEAMNLFNN